MEATQIHELLERTAAVLRSEERRLAGQFDLQPVHLHALWYLSRCNRYSDNPAAVTEYLGATKGTVSQTLGVLKQRRLISSRNDSTDRRKQHLRLTRAGTRVVEQCIPSPGITAALSESNLLGEQLESDLRELLGGLQRANGLRAFGVCASCRHLQPGETRPKFRCGLTGEALEQRSTQLICREFEETVAG